MPLINCVCSLASVFQCNECWLDSYWKTHTQLSRSGEEGLAAVHITKRHIEKKVEKTSVQLPVFLSTGLTVKCSVTQLFSHIMLTRSTSFLDQNYFLPLNLKTRFWESTTLIFSFLPSLPLLPQWSKQSDKNSFSNWSLTAMLSWKLQHSWGWDSSVGRVLD